MNDWLKSMVGCLTNENFCVAVLPVWKKMWAYEKLSFSQWYCYTAGLVSHSVVIMTETVKYWKDMNSAMNKKFPYECQS